MCLVWGVTRPSCVRYCLPRGASTEAAADATLALAGSRFEGRPIKLYGYCREIVG